MYSQVKSGSLFGLESEIVMAETDLLPGLPSFTVVGLPDISVRESKERIRSAIINSGYPFPAKRITINLAPAGTRKEGTHFDLPIAVSVMASAGFVDKRNLHHFAFLGELSLDGRINRINGALPLAIGLRRQGIHNIILPFANAEEAAAVHDLALFPVRHLKEVIAHFNNEALIERYLKKEQCLEEKKHTGDFADVAGQETAKRALQIAASASHNVLMAGPPGTGKTMMAERVAGILPEMTYEEKLEVTKIYSIAGELSENKPMITIRPFRAPHHSVSVSALVGGGQNPKPGEVSLAHLGVLFLDELPEFNRHVIEMLRQPIEDERVTISRMRGSLSFPSKFMFLASMNPCPCGYLGDPIHQCTCTEAQIQKYRSRLSGPLLDRIDIHIEILPVSYEELADEDIEGVWEKKPVRRSSDRMRMEVEAARQIQIERYRKEEISYNSQLTSGLIRKYCGMSKETRELLENAYQRLSLSARAYNKIIKLGRTIADMDGAEKIDFRHIAEAIQYRSLDRFCRGQNGKIKG